MRARLNLYLGVALVLGCHQSDECESWTDFPASFDIDLSTTTDCGHENADSTTEERAAIDACMKAAFDAGEFARSSYSSSSDNSSLADIVYNTTTWYVRPPDYEPRYLAFYTIRKLYEDGSSRESNSAMACDEVKSCDTRVCCPGDWQPLCP